MEGFLKQVSDFNNSVAFNKACKLVYYFMTALAIGLFYPNSEGCCEQICRINSRSN
jgi:hypothetical protein